MTDLSVAPTGEPGDGAAAGAVAGKPARDLGAEAVS